MPDIAAIVLAAGRGSRFGAGEADSKVAALHAGLPLVAHVVASALASKATAVIVVTGHAGAHVVAALAGLAVTIVHNPTYADGMAGSLKAGLAALPSACDGVLILLGDMPLVRRATLDALIGAFDPEACEAVVPTFDGRRGNPVLIGRALFDAVLQLEGDEGARGLLKQSGAVRTCQVDDPGVTLDIDTTEALRGLR